MPFKIIGKSVEARGNNESLDTAFKGHTLQLIFVEILKEYKIAYFLKYGCQRQFPIYFTNEKMPVIIT